MYDKENSIGFAVGVINFIEGFTRGYAEEYAEEYAKEYAEKYNKNCDESYETLYKKRYEKGEYEGRMESVAFVMKRFDLTLKSALNYYDEDIREEYSAWKDKKGGGKNG